MKTLHSESLKSISSLTGFVFVGLIPALAFGANIEQQKDPAPLTIINSSPALPADSNPIAKSAVAVPPIPTNELSSVPQVSTSTAKASPNTNPASPALVQPQTAASNKDVKVPSPTTSATTPVDTIPSVQQSPEKNAINDVIPKTSAQDQTNTQIQAVNAESTVLVPNGAALQTQLLPLNSSDSSPWSSYAAGGTLILGLAAAGVMAVRIRQGRSFGLGKAERHMQLVSCLPLSPKRQLLLVKIRDKEIALASTEQGITLLTEIEPKSRNMNTLLDEGNFEEPRKKKIQQRIAHEEPTKMIAESSETVGQETAIARSEMLMGALKNLREKNLRSKNSSSVSDSQVTKSQNDSPSYTQERTNIETSKDNSTKGEPTLKQTRAAFPKYLANAFEQESKRTISSSSNASSSGSDEAGSVTSMIRERLKELRPLA